MYIENLTEDEKEELQRIGDRIVDKMFEYPIYKKSKQDGVVVKFTGIHTGFEIFNFRGDFVNSEDEITTWVSRYDTDLWEDFDPSTQIVIKDK